MKMQLLYRIAIILYLIACFSCGKDSIEEERFIGTMQAKVNGELIVFERAGGYGFFDLNIRCSDPFHQINGTIGFDAVKHLVLCRIERRPPRLDMTIYPYLPKAQVAVPSPEGFEVANVPAGI